MKRECSNCRHWKEANTRQFHPNIKRCDEPDSPYYGRPTRGEVFCPSWETKHGTRISGKG
jgi:hypothetical protein